LEGIRWLAHENYELRLPEGSDISQVVIFPHSDNERRGIEDLRLVRFEESAELLRTPQHPWEFRQVGNCGSPLETAAGWLLSQPSASLMGGAPTPRRPFSHAASPPARGACAPQHREIRRSRDPQFRGAERMLPTRPVEREVLAADPFWKQGHILVLGAEDDPVPRGSIRR
jgi:hypothetical protein